MPQEWPKIWQKDEKEKKKSSKKKNRNNIGTSSFKKKVKADG